MSSEVSGAATPPHGLRARRLHAIMLSVLTLLLAAGCAHTASLSAGASPQRPEDVYSYCFDQARIAGDAISKDGWAPSPDYIRFTNVVDGLAGTVLPETDISTADWFQPVYARLYGTSAWRDPAARASFEKSEHDCMVGHKAASLSPIAPDARAQSQITCVASALSAVEQHFGKDTIGYTPDYRAWQHEDEDDPEPFVASEQDYVVEKGVSPFINAEATAAFRSGIKGC